MALPALRNIEMVPVEQDGQPAICLHDPEGYVEEQVVLSPPAFFVAASLDGTSDVVDVQHAFARQFGGSLIMSDDVLKVVDFLDEHGLLLSDTFYALRQRVVEAFARLPARPAHLAGKSYPQEPDTLRAFLDELFTREGGPGHVPATSGTGAPLPCLIVPHIDFARGASGYAHGYLRLYEHGKPDTVFVFGVSHVGGEVPFILTRKHFETPLGLIETDQEAVEQLASACDWPPYDEEILHRIEHSIEFQAVMLAYLYGPAVRMVPILCAALTPSPDVRDPAEVDGVARFLSACKTVAGSDTRKTAVVAGADLAHVGPRFGDPFDVDEAVLRRIEQRDREDLAFVNAVDPEGFYRSVMQDENARRVCGLGCIYAALKTVEGRAGHGELLHYGSAPDPAGGEVSFAGIALGA